jgi:hypothetical protein
VAAIAAARECIGEQDDRAARVYRNIGRDLHFFVLADAASSVAAAFAEDRNHSSGGHRGHHPDCAADAIRWHGYRVQAAAIDRRMSNQTRDAIIAFCAICAIIFALAIAGYLNGSWHADPLNK